MNKAIITYNLQLKFPNMDKKEKPWKKDWRENLEMMFKLHTEFIIPWIILFASFVYQKC